MSRFLRLLYCSQNMLSGSPQTQFREIERILDSSRQNNDRLEITGGLLFSDDCFTQVLEGAVENVERTFDRISVDQRHKNVTVLQRIDVTQRDFVSWSMAFANAGAGDQPISAARIDPVFLTSSDGGRTTLNFMQDVVKNWRDLLSDVSLAPYRDQIDIAKNDAQ